MSQAATIDNLTELLNEEQKLHRALVTADSQSIVEAVKAIALLLPRLEDATGAELQGSQRELARDLAGRIRVFQHVNHEISNGTLRTLRVCTDLLMGNSYAPAKEERSEGQTNLNVSA
jgi:hypothetical protein